MIQFNVSTCVQMKTSGGDVWLSFVFAVIHQILGRGYHRFQSTKPISWEFFFAFSCLGQGLNELQQICIYTIFLNQICLVWSKVKMNQFLLSRKFLLWSEERKPLIFIWHLALGQFQMFLSLSLSFTPTHPPTSPTHIHPPTHTYSPTHTHPIHMFLSFPRIQYRV